MHSTKPLKENDIVLCTVTCIDSAGVFVNIEEYNQQGTIILAEVSPGRIRNIREFVSVGKKIVCKVLRKKDDRIELSLRRVSAKERDIILERYKKERVLASILKPILGEKAQETLEKIKKEIDFAELLDEIRDNPTLIKNFITPAQLEQLKKILAEKKEKEKEVQKKIIVKSDAESGIQDIKMVLSTDEADISYLGSSQFLIRVKGKEYKKANIQLEKIISAMKEKAKARRVHFEIK